MLIFPRKNGEKLSKINNKNKTHSHLQFNIFAKTHVKSVYYRGQLTPKIPVFNHYYVHIPPPINTQMTLLLTLTHPKTDPNSNNLTEITTKRKGAGLTSNPLIHPLKNGR